MAEEVVREAEEMREEAARERILEDKGEDMVEEEKRKKYLVSNLTL